MRLRGLPEGEVICLLVQGSCRASYGLGMQASVKASLNCLLRMQTTYAGLNFHWTAAFLKKKPQKQQQH